MIKLLTIIGARPQIIKSAAVSRALRGSYADRIEEIVVHTGQHYDPMMSGVFFEELGISKPQYNLRVGSGRHGEQTAKMILGIEEIISTENPDYVIIYGDTNSTLAGAIAAAKMLVPVVHIEAGLRSFNKSMPEEINRILSDHVATYLFPPTQTGYENLIREGFRHDTMPPYNPDNPGIFMVGDIMYDNSLYFSSIASERSTILEREQLEPGSYVLATLHRNTNTDVAGHLNAIFTALHTLSTTYSARLVMPLHPRTIKQMDAMLEPSLYQAIQRNLSITLLPPVSFLDMIRLEQQAKLIITDSGGVQKEAFFFKKPCLILRAETEWVEIVKSGAARLCDADTQRILDGFTAYYQNDTIAFYPELYGDGNAAKAILDILTRTE